MANEARTQSEGSDHCLCRMVTVADANALTQGSLMVWSGDRTAIVHPGTISVPAGFLTEEKEALDGKTRVSVQRTGVVDAYATGTIVSGDPVTASESVANRVQTCANATLTGVSGQKCILGTALENASDGELVKIVLTLG